MRISYRPIVMTLNIVSSFHKKKSKILNKLLTNKNRHIRIIKKSKINCAEENQSPGFKLSASQYTTYHRNWEVSGFLPPLTSRY